MTQVHYVIKGCKTVGEYNFVLDAMRDESQECYEAHRKACERWTHGEPTKVWLDPDGNVCIEYEDGQWWHYGLNGEWW